MLTTYIKVAYWCDSRKMHCQWYVRGTNAHCKFLRILDGIPADSRRCFEEDNHQVVLRTGQDTQRVQRCPGKWCSSAGNPQRNYICGIEQRKRSRCKCRNLSQKLTLAQCIRSKSRRKGHTSSRRSTHHQGSSSELITTCKPFCLLILSTTTVNFCKQKALDPGWRHSTRVYNSHLSTE